MINSKTTLPLLLLLLSILPLACSTPKALEYRTFKNFTIEKLGFSSTAIKLDLIYFNPNNYGIELKTTDVDIFINDSYLGHSAQDYQISIPKKEEFSIPLKMDVDMRNILKNGLNTFIRNEVTVKITGSIKVGKANVFMIFPILYEGKQTFSFF